MKILLACILAPLALLALASPTLADSGVVFLTLDITDKHQITDYDLFFLEDGGYEFTKRPGTLTLSMLSEDGDVLYATGFTPAFLVLSNPPVRTDRTTVILTLPYDRRVRSIRIHDNATEIFSLTLQESICNLNGACDGFENVYSCPGDCSPWSDDGVCASPSHDGGCDPDCPSWRDLDCSCPNGVCEYWESAEYCAADCGEGPGHWVYAVYLIPLSLLAGVASFLVTRRHQSGRRDKTARPGNGL